MERLSQRSLSAFQEVVLDIRPDTSRRQSFPFGNEACAIDDALRKSPLDCLLFPYDSSAARNHLIGSSSNVQHLTNNDAEDKDCEDVKFADALTVCTASDSFQLLGTPLALRHRLGARSKR